MPHTFHQQALRALGITHSCDEASVEALRTRAAELRIPLPAAFVEWFGMANGHELLHRHSNGDDRIEIELLGDPARVSFAVDDRSWPNLPLLPFMVEKTGRLCLGGAAERGRRSTGDGGARS